MVRTDPLVAAAEEAAQLEFCDCYPEGADLLDADVPADELTAFAQRVMAEAGWVGNAVPEFVLDIPDESDLAGMHRGATGAIHLHPRLLTPWTILHELAHWLRPMDGHGPQFCGTQLGLVRAGIHPDAAVELERAYAEHGVEVDRNWAT